MNCWHCGNDLIWGGDHDIDEEDNEFSVVSNLSCPQCKCEVLVYLPRDKSAEDNNIHNVSDNDN